MCRFYASSVGVSHGRPSTSCLIFAENCTPSKKVPDLLVGKEYDVYAMVGTPYKLPDKCPDGYSKVAGAHCENFRYPGHDKLTGATLEEMAAHCSGDANCFAFEYQEKRGNRWLCESNKTKTGYKKFYGHDQSVCVRESPPTTTSSTTSTLTTTSTTTTSTASCESESKINDFSSKVSMQAAGWTGLVGSYDFKPVYDNAASNLPSTSYWGFSPGNPALELRLPLSGSGQVTVSFGNYWGGNVDLFLNDVKKCSAGTKQVDQSVSMSFQQGDVLKIGEYNTAILVLNRISITCQPQAVAMTNCGQSQIRQPETKVTGSFDVQGAAGLSQSKVETASRQALSTHFNIGTDQVTTSATQQRRLDVAPRQLAGNWAIEYELQIHAFQVAAIQETNAATRDDAAVFTSVLKNAFIGVGMSLSAGNSIAAVAGSTAVVHSTTTETTTTTAAMVELSSVVMQHALPLWALASTAAAALFLHGQAL